MFGIFKKSDDLELNPLKLFNTESKQLEEFEPLSRHEVKMYTCGPTVYDYIHVGNLRSFVFADLLKRVLFLNGYNVNHTINFTDFGCLTSEADSGEDKMMKGLKREGLEISLQNMRLLADRYIKAFKDDVTSLNNLPPTQYSRASDFVREQVKLIETLDEKGYTYETSDGVYFDISKFPTYGRLGNIDLDGLKSGARVEENTEKKHPADFAVWKKGDLGWESKWGQGFPGWHIECSAMAFATLGKQIDIHTGGIDLVPTHHNGEIAQSEAATGKQFVKYWLHNEHLHLNGEKIAKSSGNVLNLPDLHERGITGDDYRYYLMTTHYRTQVNVNDEALEGAKQALTRLKRLVYEEWQNEKGKLNQNYFNRFTEAVNNDLDTPKAIAVIWELIKDESVPAGEKKITIQECDAVLGVGLSLSNEEGMIELGHVSSTEIPEEVQSLVDEREAARVAQNWAQSDLLREKINLLGYTIEDSAEGPKLIKK